MSDKWTPTRILDRRENKIRQRSVVGVERTSEFLHLNLSGGGWLFYSSNTSMREALLDAEDRGFCTGRVDL